mmetsp:Transcript_13821/g.20842  ORF Transcript_13821/g.20842 Transcript_13821/m.20842 type:complete len:181 (+) Transcript_13821:42-584(+)
MNNTNNLKQRHQPYVSLSTFSFLIAELVRYTQSRVNNVVSLEKRLSEIGYSVGVRMFELISFREKSSKRETKLVGILSFIHSTVWRALFGKQADSLERSIEHENEYMIIENETLVNKYISVPKNLSNLNCAAFAAGIVHGILDSSNHKPEKVTAFAVPVEGQKNPKTVILVRFPSPTRTV